jgi:anti-anti-sigma regulatory factor
MAPNPVCPEIDGRADLLVRSALERLDTAENELILDFSGVRRVDPAAVRSLAELAAKAQAHSVRIVIEGVNIEIYKVLRLLAMAAQFSFRT